MAKKATTKGPGELVRCRIHDGDGDECQKPGPNGDYPLGVACLSDRVAKGEARYEGQNLFVMTATFHWIGRCIAETDTYIRLEDASMISQTGLLQELCNGKPEIIERLPLGYWDIPVGCITGIGPWPHSVPVETRGLNR